MNLRGIGNIGIISILLIALIFGYLFLNSQKTPTEGPIVLYNKNTQKTNQPIATATTQIEILPTLKAASLGGAIYDYSYFGDEPLQIGITTNMGGKNRIESVEFASSSDKDIALFIVIPKGEAQSASEVSVSEKVTVVKDDPVLLLPLKLKSNEKKQISITTQSKSSLSFLYIMVDQGIVDAQPELLNEIGDVLSKFGERDAVVATKQEASRLSIELSRLMNGPDTLSQKLAKLSVILMNSQNEKISFDMQIDELHPWSQISLSLFSPKQFADKILYKHTGALTETTTSKISTDFLKDQNGYENLMAISYIVKQSQYNKFSGKIDFDVIDGELEVQAPGSTQKFTYPVNINIDHKYAVEVFPTRLRFFEKDGKYPAKPIIILNSAPFNLQVQPVLAGDPLSLETSHKILQLKDSEIQKAVIFSLKSDKDIVSAPVGGFKIEIIEYARANDSDIAQNLSEMDVWAPKHTNKTNATATSCGSNYCNCRQVNRALALVYEEFSSDISLNWENSLQFMEASKGSMFARARPVLYFDTEDEEGCFVPMLENGKLKNGYNYLAVFSLNMTNGTRSFRAIDLGMPFAVFKSNDKGTIDIYNDEASFRQIIESREKMDG